jgi:hypothetical protein
MQGVLYAAVVAAFLPGIYFIDLPPPRCAGARPGRLGGWREMTT